VFLRRKFFVFYATNPSQTCWDYHLTDEAQERKNNTKPKEKIIAKAMTEKEMESPRLAASSSNS
jgi:hypothetical protein